MAKKKSKTEDTKKGASPAARAEAAASYKYGVQALADELGVKPASARVALRKHNIEKAEGGVYGWNSEKEFKAVVKQLSKSGKDAE